MYDLKDLRLNGDLTSVLARERVLIKYTKEVQDPNQMVPLFTAVISVPESTIPLWFEVLYPQCHAYLQTLNPCLRGLLYSTLTAYIADYNLNDAAFLAAQENTALVPCVMKQFGTKTSAYRAITSMQSALESEDTNKLITSRLLDLLMALVPVNAKTNGSTIQDVGWHYGIFPTMSGHADRRAPGSLIQATTERDDKYGLKWESFGSSVVRYAFLGMFMTPTISVPGISRFSWGSQLLYERERFWSARSMLTVPFCVMIKAKKRADLIIELIAGDFVNMVWEKGDIELWEDADITTILSKPWFTEYKKLYYIPFRNQIKAPVKTFKLLAHQIFDIPTVTTKSPSAVSAELNAVIQHARKLHLSIAGAPSTVSRLLSFNTHYT